MESRKIDKMTKERTAAIEDGNADGHDDEIVKEIERQASSSGRSLRRWLFAAGFAIAAHEPAYHFAVKAGYERYMLEPYQAWQAESQKQEIAQSLGADQRDALENDRKLVSERNAERLDLIKAREAQAKAFKEDIYKNYGVVTYRNIFFPVEYFDMGSRDEEKTAAESYFEIISDGVQVEDASQPQHHELKKLVSAMMPDGSYERTKSSATRSLFEGLGKKSQNCVARTRLMVMATARKYPSLQKQIYIQKFGDHVRALFEINGKRYVLEGGVAEFPDNETKEKKNEVMPFEVWLALYGGHKRSEFEDRIERHGPQGADRKKTDNYARVTDDMVPENFWDSDLDNVGSADSWFASGNGEAGGNSGGASGSGRVGDGGLSSDKVSDNADEGPTTVLEDKNGETNMTLNKPVQPKEIRYEYETITFQQAEAFRKDAEARNVREMQFPNLRKLDKATAKALATDYDEKTNTIQTMSFDALNEIDEDAAYELSKFEGRLYFGGFPQLPVPAMKGLFYHHAAIHFKTRIASVESLEALVGRKPGSSDLSDFFDLKDLLPENADSNFEVSASPDGSAYVPQRRGQLTIEGLVGLSAEAAEILSRYNGVLNFVNVSFSKAAAERLAGHKNQIFLVNPSIEGLAGFAEHEEFMDLRIRVPSEKVSELAEAVVGHRGEISLAIDMKGGSLPLDAAKIFGTRKGKLSFNNASTDISDEALGLMAPLEGDLRIGGVPKTLSVETAKKLSGHKGALYLDHITDLSPEAAMYLARARAYTISLNGLKNLTPEVARAFANYKGELQFSGIGEISTAAARHLAGQQGTLILGLKSVTPAVLRELLHHKGQIIIQNVPLMTVEMAQVLAGTSCHFSFWRAQIRSHKAARLLHPKKELVSIDDIAMMRINAPDRGWKFEEE
jgi:hypothetical protein